MNAKPFFRHGLFLLTLLFTVAACTSTQELVERGDYDGAIVHALRKLHGKKKKKIKYVEGIETAFQKVTQRDMQALEQLKADRRADKWVRINAVHQKIADRQRRVEPFLPLVADNGYQANFNFVRVAALERESRRKAADFYYESAKDLLAKAKRGDKLAAREAFAQLENIEQYYQNYRDTRSLEQEALHLGVVHILVKMRNDAPVVLPRQFEREALRISVGELNSRWKEYHLNDTRRNDFDYNVVMRLTSIAVSPESVKEREYMDSKEVEDGFDYVLDDNGNVMKDTLGNDIKVPRFKTIKAYVFETYQSKAATVAGKLEFYDNRYNRLLRTENLATEVVFDNYASTFRGDRRALSRDSKRYLGNQPVPFPSSEVLLMDAAERLKPLVKDKIYRNRSLI